MKIKNNKIIFFTQIYFCKECKCPFGALVTAITHVSRNHESPTSRQIEWAEICKKAAVLFLINNN